RRWGRSARRPRRRRLRRSGRGRGVLWRRRRAAGIGGRRDITGGAFEARDVLGAFGHTLAGRAAVRGRGGLLEGGGHFRLTLRITGPRGRWYFDFDLLRRRG